MPAFLSQIGTEAASMTIGMELTDPNSLQGIKMPFRALNQAFDKINPFNDLFDQLELSLYPVPAYQVDQNLVDLMAKSDKLESLIASSWIKKPDMYLLPWKGQRAFDHLIEKTTGEPPHWHNGFKDSMGHTIPISMDPDVNREHDWRKLFNVHIENGRYDVFCDDMLVCKAHKDKLKALERERKAKISSFGKMIKSDPNLLVDIIENSINEGIAFLVKLFSSITINYVKSDPKRYDPYNYSKIMGKNRPNEEVVQRIISALRHLLQHNPKLFMNTLHTLYDDNSELLEKYRNKFNELTEQARSVALQNNMFKAMTR
ncbi:MAG: hypothetical protein N0E59_02325 [Candidatus Thiodiazotropha taylori]|nr:hypothetical protein [Candidatus Thiodiazotropha taylori]MCG8051898.1 hypothetical protein [Candidatus Thiodiazotropha taylori]MCG8107013.1 hypothetical protein [Candidatus Thiodiazotropha taylori]MCG8109576.1 hypothetical protein [Candidatus Thiodiazotropha taylori]MCW4279349.1 hypothetical protein [Candidatus Thiodiazotropha taylori]